MNGQSPASQVHWLPLRRHDQNTLAWQRVESLSRGLCRDQAVSTQVGFYVQMTGKLTNCRYRGATIFVDHYPQLRFIHLMQDSSPDKTIKAKRAFEQFAADHCIKIAHYHCNNGRFKDNAFKQACESTQQRLTFCPVNAHFQNGIAERSIRDLSENVR